MNSVLPTHRALGFDGGLAHAGVVVAELTPRGPKFLWGGVAETKKGTDCLVAEDHHRRATELARYLELVFDRHQPSVVYAENFSPPRDARNASMLAWSWGVMSATAARHGAKVLGKSPVRLKDALTGDRGAKKDEMIRAAREQYPELEPWFAQLRPDMHEHLADAAAAVHAFCGARA